MYVNGRSGQLHARKLTAKGDELKPPLLCLHPAPYSGLYFTTVMPLLNDDRLVLAPDYPGYGGSSAPLEWPSIDDYALAMLDLVDDLELPQFDILGFHTGCLVGAEMALRAADRIGRLILIDIPFFDAEARRERFERETKPRKFSPDLACLADEWAFNITKRLDTMSFERAFELLTESLRAADRANWAFGAAYSYAGETRLPSLATDTVFIATQSGLLEPTRAAAAAVPSVRLVERLDIKPPVFEKNAEKITAEIVASLK